jgi:3'(2'), 5'-bisphosphate nucleotidase
MSAPILAFDDCIALLDPLADLARAASAAILAIPRDAMMRTDKSDGSPVTRADLEADAVLVDGLQKLAPQIPIVSEERAASATGPFDGSFFIIDPLDGTREYVAGRDEYAVNIAVITRGKPVLGVIASPTSRQTWRGLIGHGAERLDWTGTTTVTPIRTRRHDRNACSVVASRSHLDARTAAFVAAHRATTTTLGSALKFCHVADGRADIYPRLAPTSEWDVAAGMALVTAAGGKVTRGDGSELLFGRREAKFLVPDFIAWGDPSAS